MGNYRFRYRLQTRAVPVLKYRGRSIRLKSAHDSSWSDKHAMRGQTQFCLLIYNPMNTIVKSIIEYSYWSYVHQLSYRKGEPHYLYILFHSDPLGLYWSMLSNSNTEEWTTHPLASLRTIQPLTKHLFHYDCHSDRVHDNARHILHMLHTVCLLVDKVTRPKSHAGQHLAEQVRQLRRCARDGWISTSHHILLRHSRRPSVEAIKGEGPTQSHWNIENRWFFRSKILACRLLYCNF